MELKEQRDLTSYAVSVQCTDKCFSIGTGPGFINMKLL